MFLPVRWRLRDAQKAILAADVAIGFNVVKNAGRSAQWTRLSSYSAQPHSGWGRGATSRVDSHASPPASQAFRTPQASGASPSRNTGVAGFDDVKQRQPFVLV